MCSEPRRQRHATESSKDRQRRRVDNINEKRVAFNLQPTYSDADPLADILPARPRSAHITSSREMKDVVPGKPMLCETKSDDCK